MLNTMKKITAATIFTAMALPASASLVTFTDANAGGTLTGINTVDFDEITVTTQNDAVITQTFVDGINDPFVEVGLTGLTGFKKDGASVATFLGAPSPIGFELIFDVMLAGTAATTDLGGGVFDVDVTFGNTSVASLYYGQNMDNDIAGDTKIADLALTLGSCDLTIDTNDINIKTQSIFGRRGYSIGHYAKVKRADLLVMSAPNKTGFLDRIFPHDLEYILSELPTDVLIVK